MPREAKLLKSSPLRERGLGSILINNSNRKICYHTIEKARFNLKEELGGDPVNKLIVTTFFCNSSIYFFFVSIYTFWRLI